MSLFEKCGRVANRYAMAEQIVNDGFVYMSPGRKDVKRKIAMGIRETETGLEVYNLEKVDITEWLGYLQEKSYLVFCDGAGTCQVADAKREVMRAMSLLDEKVSLRFCPGAISFRVDIYH